MMPDNPVDISQAMSRNGMVFAELAGKTGEAHQDSAATNLRQPEKAGS